MKILSKIGKAFFLACFMQMVTAPLSAAWSPSVPVSTPGQSAATFDGPVLSVNALNNGVAVWSSPPGLFANIEANSYTFGTGWGSPVIISDTSLNQFGDPIYIGQGDPQVSMNNNNYAVAVWEGSQFLIDVEESLEGVFSATRSSDGTWSPVQRISALNLVDSDFDPENPVCAVNDAGLAVVIWGERRNNDRYIMSSFLQIGGSWTTPVQLEGPISGFREDTPAVAIDPNGNVIACWKRDSGTGGDTVVAATFNAVTATWSAPVILDPVADSTGLPKTGIDDNGNGIVVWDRLNGSLSEVVSASFTYGTGWGPQVIVFQTITGSVDHAQVVMDHFGNATAAWNSDDTGVFQVYSSHLPFGGSWSTPEIVSINGTDNSINVGFVQRPLSVDSQGTVLVIFDDPNGQIQSAARFFNDGWQAPENIVIDNDRSQNIGGGSCGFAISLWMGDLDGFHVVQSSVNFGPFPAPVDFKGQKFKPGSKCHVKTCNDCYNLLQWSPLECVDHYLLYRGTDLIATISGDGPTFFKDCVNCRGCTEYTIVAVSIYDVESAPVTIEVC